MFFSSIPFLSSVQKYYTFRKCEKNPKRNVKKQRREDRTGINTHYNYDKMTAMFTACIYMYFEEQCSGLHTEKIWQGGENQHFRKMGGSAIIRILMISKLLCL